MVVQRCHDECGDQRVVCRGEDNGDSRGLRSILFRSSLGFKSSPPSFSWLTHRAPCDTDGERDILPTLDQVASNATGQSRAGG